MDEQNKGVPITCPDPGRWLAVASGAEAPEVMEQLCAHAADCNQCGPRLKEALKLLSDDEDPAENQFVAALTSSQPGWQKKQAERLAEAEKEKGAKLSWFSTPWRFAAVCLASLLALGIFWMANLRHHENVSPPPVLSTTSPVPAVTTPQAVTPQVELPPVLVASLTLEPGLTRGLDRVPVLKLPNETRTVSLTLLFLDAPPSRMRVELVNSARETVWARNLDLSDAQIRKQRVTLSVPADLMRPDDYQLMASERGAGGMENVASYSFGVKR